MPVTQVMQDMMATVRPVETDKSGSGSSTTMVESMPPWAGPAVEAECAGEECVEGIIRSVAGDPTFGCRIVVFKGIG